MDVGAYRKQRIFSRSTHPRARAPSSEPELVMCIAAVAPSLRVKTAEHVQVPNHCAYRSCFYIHVSPHPQRFSVAFLQRLHCLSANGVTVLVTPRDPFSFLMSPACVGPRASVRAGLV